MNDTSHFNFIISLERLGWKFKGTDNDTGEKIYTKTYNKALSYKEYQLGLSDTIASYLFYNSLGITRIELAKDLGDNGLPTSIPYNYAKSIVDEIEILENELLKANIPFSENYFTKYFTRNDKAVLNREIRSKFDLSELECDLKKDLEEKEKE